MMGGRTPELDRPLKRLRHIIEAAIIYPIFWGVRLLSFPTASALGSWLGRKVGYRTGQTKRARRNLKRIFPDKTEAEIESILIGMWDNLGRTIFEFPNLHKIKFDGDGGQVDVINLERLTDLSQQQKGLICFSGHLANWEILTALAWHHGIPMQFIYRAPNNPLVHKLFRSRLMYPEALVPKGSEGAKHLLATLRKGGPVGMLADQKMNEGVSVPFLGEEAMTATALAIFALKFGCPVIPAQIIRLSGPKFKVIVGEPVYFKPSGDKDADHRRIMTWVNDQLSAWVLENPTQWLWTHNRWPKK